MLGWEIFVHRERDIQTIGSSRAPSLASWMTSIGGLDWLDKLVNDGKAADLGGNGYPLSYSVSARVLLPILKLGVPENRSPPVFGDDYYIPEGWTGTVKQYDKLIRECGEDEQLIVEAWDQS